MTKQTFIGLRRRGPERLAVSKIQVNVDIAINVAATVKWLVILIVLLVS